MKCPKCGFNLVSRDNMTHTPETFKKTFKLNDVVRSSGWGKYVVITGIGKYRFYGIDHDDFEKPLGSKKVNNVERPYTMYGNWQKMDITIKEE